MTLGPVLVTPLPARTAKALAVPRSTGGCAARAPVCVAMTTATLAASAPVASQANLGLREMRVKAAFIWADLPVENAGCAQLRRLDREAKAPSRIKYRLSEYGREPAN